MAAISFTTDEIRQYAFPAVIETGKRHFARGRVKGIHAVGHDIIASVSVDSPYRVVLSKDRGRTARFACNCGFAYGGACEHAVAAMFALNAQDSVQTGLNLGLDRDDDNKGGSEQSPTQRQDQKITSIQTAPPDAGLSGDDSESTDAQIHSVPQSTGDIRDDNDTDSSIYKIGSAGDDDPVETDVSTDPKESDRHTCPFDQPDRGDHANLDDPYSPNDITEVCPLETVGTTGVESPFRLAEREEQPASGHENESDDHLGTRNTTSVTDVPETLVETVSGKPVARLYLNERDSMLLVEIRFAYLDGLTEFGRTDTNRERLVPGPQGHVYRIVRSRAREDAMLTALAEYELMRYQSGIYTPCEDPRDWILGQLPRLARKGYEIFGQDKLTVSRARKSLPRLSVNVFSKGDSLSCNISISFDEIPATLAALIQAVKADSRYVLLADGSSGVLPEAWMRKFSSLFAVGEHDEKDDRLTLKRYHTPVADMLFDMADEHQANEEFLQKREALRSFSGIMKQPPPETFKGTMRQYQAAGYEWFYFLQSYNFGGCLADDMGLGKTVQTIALLLNEKEQGRKPSIVIVPASLLFNWEREARQFAPSMLVMLFHGPERRKYGTTEMKCADLVLTTYGTAMRDITLLKRVPFNYIVIDEAQAIKNPASRVGKAIKELNARHRLALSGTPVENNLSELWSIFSFLNPGMLGTYRHFAQNFAKPVERDGQPEAAQVLQKMLFPFILRRTKQQVATDLPPKTESVIYTEMLPRQRTLYQITRDTYRGRIMQSIDQLGMEKSGLQILEGLLRLRQICCHPALMDPVFNGESGKFKLLDGILEDIISEGHKVLIFSQFVKALELIRKRLTTIGVKSEILTGKTRDRAAVVDRFQNCRDVPVFLISLKAGGTGLNLTSAEYVIHLDPWWNPAAENQASDRAYRIGQKNHVFVYKLIMKDSIEERVLALQESKKQLVDQIIRTENSFFKQLTKKDIVGLFS